MNNMKTLTNERLNKIASWRKTYGTEHNIMIPAGEIEELVQRLLAAEIEVTSLRRERETMHSIEYVQGLVSKIAELEEQLAELGRQEPVAYGINIDGRNIYRDERSLPIYRGTGHEITPVYAAPVPAPVPQAVSQPVRPIGFIEAKSQGTDTYTLKCFYRPSGAPELVGQEVYASQPASQPALHGAG